MNELHLVWPHHIDDESRPSGGNHYNRRIADGLARTGWTVREHVVPTPDGLAGLLESLPAAATVLIDGLLGSRAGAAMAGRSQRLVLLMHLPLGPDELERQAVQAADQVVATSAWTSRWLLHHYGIASVTATPGVDPVPPADPGPVSFTTGGPATASLLFIGALTPIKGADLLIEALLRVHDLRWRCDFVGSAEPAPVFAAALRARAEPLGDRVRWRGALARANVDQALCHADLLVAPSRLETYGMALTEALARGVPVIASDVGGTSEALGRDRGSLPGGLLVPMGDSADRPDLAVDRIASQLRRWLTDAELRAQLRAAAAARRETLSGWDRTVANVAGALGATPAAS